MAFQSRKALTTLAPKLHTHTLSSGCGSGPHQHHEQHGTYSCAVQWSHRSWLPCQGLPRLTLLCHAGAAACPLVLAFTSRSDCTVTSFLSPSVRVPWLTFSSLVPALHLQPLSPLLALALQTSVNIWPGQRPSCGPSPEGGLGLLQFARRSQQL